MKTFKTNICAISLLLSALTLLQSCVAYKQGTYTLEEASRTETKVKLKTIDNETLKFKKIEFINDKYYGVIKINGLSNMVEIESARIKYAKLQDKTMSTVLTIAVPVIVLGGIIGLTANALNHMKVF